MMVRPLTVLLKPEVKQEKASQTVEVKRTVMQVRITPGPKFLAVCSFLTSFFCCMVIQKLKKYYKPIYIDSKEINTTNKYIF